jgi:protein gp37
MGDKGLVKKYDLKKYYGEPKLYPKELRRIENSGEDDFWFVQDMSDLFADNVPKEMIEAVLNAIRNAPKNAKFLLLTKNPKRYFEFIHSIPNNCILGATIESDIDYPNVSKAPSQTSRLQVMQELAEVGMHRLFISVEPVMKFTAMFAKEIEKVKPWAVAVGYDNYGNNLPEPLPLQTRLLISALEQFTIVYRKTLK